MMAPTPVTRLPPIPEPTTDPRAMLQTVHALKHAMNILAINAGEVSRAQIFARADEMDKLKQELEGLKAEFAAYKAAHP